MNHAAATPPVMTSSAKATANTISRIKPSTCYGEQTLGRGGSTVCEQDHRAQGASEAASNPRRGPLGVSRVHQLRGSATRLGTGFLCKERQGYWRANKSNVSFTNTKQALVAISSPRQTQRRSFALGAMQNKLHQLLGIPPPHSSAKNHKLAWLDACNLLRCRRCKGSLEMTDCSRRCGLFSDAVNGSCWHVVPQT